MKEIKPIETIYKGHRFRSRLEARWAVFFDHIGINWIYEPEGFEFPDGTKYLPDFYLPDSKQFFEVKGIMDDEDRKKITALIMSGCDVVVGYDDGKFQALSDGGKDCGGLSLEFDSCGESWLCRCRSCGKSWFMGSVGVWNCRCCGEYDGDHHISMIMTGDGWYGEKWDCARQARFEHGEAPRV